MSGALVILSIFTAIHLLRYWGEKGKLHRYYTSACPPPEVLPKEIILQGEHFELSDDDLDRILKRRFIYYSFLEENLKHGFSFSKQKMDHYRMNYFFQLLCSLNTNGLFWREKQEGTAFNRVQNNFILYRLFPVLKEELKLPQGGARNIPVAEIAIGSIFFAYVSFSKSKGPNFAGINKNLL